MDENHSMHKSLRVRYNESVAVWPGRACALHIQHGVCKEWQRSRAPWVMAHRGDSARAPENTLSAFRLAVEAGVDALETDVHWTSDGEVVVSHDATVDRNTDGRGNIRDLTLAQLRKLDFGWRFTLDGGNTFPYRGQGIRILTLEELLNHFPTARVTVEIKPEHPASLQRLLQVIGECGAHQRVLLASFHHQVLTRVRQMTDRVGTGASSRETLGVYIRSQFLSKFVHPAKSPFCVLQLPLQQMGLQVVNRRFIRYAHEARMAVHVWTVDEASQWERLWEAGVDGIVTNRPREAVQARDIWWRRHLHKAIREA